MAEKITKHVVEAAKTAEVIFEEKIGKPTLDGVKAIPKSVVEMSKDAVQSTKNAAQATKDAVANPHVVNEKTN